MFVTDLVRNIAWSLRRSRRSLPNPESVLPADAVAPVAPVRSEPQRRPAEDAAGDRFHHAPEPRESATESTETAPGGPDDKPHIDVRV